MRLLSREEFLEMPPYTFYVEGHTGSLRMKMETLANNDNTKSLALNEPHGGYSRQRGRRQAAG